MLQTKIVEKIKTHTLCSRTFFLEHPALYETVGENMVRPDRSMVTI